MARLGIILGLDYGEIRVADLLSPRRWAYEFVCISCASRHMITPNSHRCWYVEERNAGTFAAFCYVCGQQVNQKCTNSTYENSLINRAIADSDEIQQLFGSAEVTRS